MVHRKYNHTRRVQKKSKPYKTSMSRSIAGGYGAFISPRIRTVLKYNESKSITSTAGIVNDYQFRLNSIFDPDYTGGGHQPLGRDQLAGLYNRYRVDKVAVSVTFHKNSESACIGHAICANNSSTGFTNPWNAITEQSNVSWKVDSASTAGSVSKVTLKRVFHLNKVTGVSLGKYRDDDRYQADIASNPAEEIMLHICNCDILEASSSNTIMQVNLRYYVEFFDPHVVAQS